MNETILVVNKDMDGMDNKRYRDTSLDKGFYQLAKEKGYIILWPVKQTKRQYKKQQTKTCPLIK